MTTTAIIPLRESWDVVAPQAGAYRMPHWDYHAAPGVSQSMLSRLSRSPAHLQSYLAEPREPTPAQEFGSLFHLRLFEPHIYCETGTHHVKPPGFDGRTKEGRAWLAERDNLPVITHQEALDLERMRSSVLAHHYGSGLVGAPGVSEVSLFAAFFELFDHQPPLSKGRLDRVVRADDGKLYIVDAKTCEDASPEGFAKFLTAWDCHRQAAYYLDMMDALGHPCEDFLWLAVEKKAPYAVGVYRLSEEDIDAGRRLYQRELTLYDECTRKGEWPGYAQAIVDLRLKPWAKGKEWQ